MFWLCLILHISLLHFDTMFLHKMLLEVYTTKRTIWWPMYVMILNNLLDLWRIGPRIRSNGRALLAASLTSLKHNALELLYGMQLLLCYNTICCLRREEGARRASGGVAGRRVSVIESSSLRESKMYSHTSRSTVISTQNQGDWREILWHIAQNSVKMTP